MQLSNLACSGRSRSGRLLVSFFISGALLMLASRPLLATPATTVISDVLYRADGSPAAGTMLISWPAFSTSDGKPVAAGSMSLPIGTGGNVTLALAPNEGAIPSGTYYKVVLKLDDGTTSTEYWTVPRKTPVKIAEVRSSIVPTSVAMQMVSRQYVDSTLSAKADDQSVIHKLGEETITGTKQFSVSPLVPTPTVESAAASKSYVDSAVAGVSTGDFIRKSGDTMSGSLVLAGDPTTMNQAANRHYVDLQVASATSAVAQKLGRQGDTPITMAGVRYATQFPSIQAAITDAGTTGTVIIPSDYTGTDTFTNPNKVQVIDLRGDAAGTRGVYNVRDFGAVPSDGQDDWAAIQAAIDAASAGSPPYAAVYVPKGTYHVSKPLHVTRGIKFYGAGRGVTTITGYTADQGAVMVVSPPTSLGYAGVPTGPALVTGNGNSMYLNGTTNYLLNLRENGAVELNGRGALTVELFYKAETSVSTEMYNIISSSGSVTGPDGNTSVAIMHSTDDSILGILNVGGSVRFVSTPTHSITPGTTVHIALTFDGTTIRLFLNGVLKGSLAISGTIVQKASEDFVIGPKVGAFLDGPTDNKMAKGWVDSVRISSNARYTSNFTAPTAKLANDGTTMFLLNFDNNYDQFTTATTMYGTEHLFLRRFGGGMGQVGNFHLSDLSFIGTGPEFIYTISSLIDNVQITAARRGLEFINNCYLNRLTSVRVIGQATTQFGLGIGVQSGVLTMTDVSLSGGHFPLYVDTSSVLIDGLWIEMTNGAEIGALFKGGINNAVVINNPIISAETGPTTVRYSMAMVGIGSVVMNGGVLETYNNAPFVGVFGGGSIIHSAGTYSGGVAPATVFQIVTPPVYPVQLFLPLQLNMSVPWADNMTWMQASQVKTSQACSGSDKVSGISSTGSLVCLADQGGGYVLTLMSTPANAPANASTYYFGGNILDNNNTNFDAAKIDVPKSGTIKRIYIRENVPSGSVGSAENVTHKVCVNSSASCFGSAAFAYNSASAAGRDITLSQPVTAGDTIAIRVDTPTWTTRPNNVRWYATVYIE